MAQLKLKKKSTIIFLCYIISSPLFYIFSLRNTFCILFCTIINANFKFAKLCEQLSIAAVFSTQRFVEEFDSDALLSSYLTSEILSFISGFQYTPTIFQIKCVVQQRMYVFSLINFSITSKSM